MNADAITTITPTIPPRRRMLARAVQSIARQTHPAHAMSIAVDVNREGAPATRQRALDVVQTPLVAAVDDDDELMAFHLADLLAHMRDTGADMVYSWFRVVAPNGAIYPEDPVFPPGHFLNEFDPEHPIETTVTVLARTELAKEVGYHALDRGHDANTGEDYAFTLGCVRAGAKIRHLVKHTWFWHHHGGNTAGRPDRW